MKNDVGRVLVRELEAFAREVELFPDDLTLWRTLPGVTNVLVPTNAAPPAVVPTNKPASTNK